MKPEIIKKNEEIKIGMFLSILGILVFMLSAYLAYFYSTESQRLLREDSTSLAYILSAFVVAVFSLFIGVKSILNTYRIISNL